MVPSPTRTACAPRTCLAAWAPMRPMVTLAADSARSFNPATIDSLSPLSTGSRQQYGLQLRGGTETIRYFLHGEWEDETGLQVLPSAERQRLLSDWNATHVAPPSACVHELIASQAARTPDAVALASTASLAQVTCTLPQFGVSDQQLAAYYAAVAGKLAHLVPLALVGPIDAVADLSPLRGIETPLGLRLLADRDQRTPGRLPQRWRRPDQRSGRHQPAAGASRR